MLIRFSPSCGRPVSYTHLDVYKRQTDDGSYGEKGVVTAPLEKKIVEGANFDEGITIGPLIMMKVVVKTTKPHNVKTVVSMNPIMVDRCV